MAIPCPGCGRQYDVTLFAFGRTLSCTCGARVALEIRHVEPDSPPRFVADEMLERLARWLRALGYDTLHTPGVEDAELVRTAFEQHRLLLTRDRGLCREWRFDNCVVVDAAKPAAQLRELDARFGVGRDWRSHLFTRCMVCNTALDRLTSAGPRPGTSAPGQGGGRLPAAGDVHSFCPGCGRIYWEGLHTRRMRTFLSRVFDENGDQAGTVS